MWCEHLFYLGVTQQLSTDSLVVCAAASSALRIIQRSVNRAFDVTGIYVRHAAVYDDHASGISGNSHLHITLPTRSHANKVLRDRHRAVHAPYRNPRVRRASASDFDGIEQCVTIASEESVIHACTHDDFVHMSMSVGLMRRRVARISAGSLHITELS